MKKSLKIFIVVAIFMGFASQVHADPASCYPEEGVDNDGDCIVDTIDECDDYAGYIWTKWHGRDWQPGCPYVIDMSIPENAERNLDGDAFTNEADKCDDEFGAVWPPNIENYEDEYEQGCLRQGHEPTENDLDADGLVHEDDECPNQPGILALGGCPIEYKEECTGPGADITNCSLREDPDEDGLVNAYDRCPDEALDGYYSMETLGCPEEVDEEPERPVQVMHFAVNWDFIRRLIEANQNTSDDNVAPPPEEPEINNDPIDTDGDGIYDENDNCTLANADQADMDQDGIGDLCDDDIDNDGFLNPEDECPTEVGEDKGCPQVVVVEEEEDQTEPPPEDIKIDIPRRDVESLIKGDCSLIANSGTPSAIPVMLLMLSLLPIAIRRW